MQRESEKLVEPSWVLHPSVGSISGGTTCMWEAKYLKKQCVSVHPWTSNPLAHLSLVCFPARTPCWTACADRAAKMSRHTLLSPLQSFHTSTHDASVAFQNSLLKHFPPLYFNIKFEAQFLQSPPNNYFFALFWAFLVFPSSLFPFKAQTVLWVEAFYLLSCNFPPSEHPWLSVYIDLVASSLSICYSHMYLTSLSKLYDCWG